MRDYIFLINLLQVLNSNTCSIHNRFQTAYTADPSLQQIEKKYDFKQLTVIMTIADQTMLVDFVSKKANTSFPSKKSKKIVMKIPD